MYKKLTALALWALLLGALLLATGCDNDDDDDATADAQLSPTVALGPRPAWLIDDLDAGELKDELMACANGPFAQSDFSIGHRGAPYQFPEHTKESYEAAARMGAGILECDVTFTKDAELVCRHAQCDLHTTTNILATDLAAKCSVPFTPAQFDQDGNITAAASAQCCTSDITLAEFKTLTGKMDAANGAATTVEEYMDGTASWRTDLYASYGTLLTHAESIELFKNLDAKMTPELKGPAVEMPFDTDGDGEGDFSQADYAQKMIDEYKAAGVPASDVFAQSFNYDDVIYWVENEANFGEQAVFLDGRYDPVVANLAPSFEEIVEDGVNIIAPPMWVLLSEEGDKVVASDYAMAAKNAGLDIITWTFERSAPLTPESIGSQWYHQTTTNVIDSDGDKLESLDVLAQDVGILGIFSDWPAIVTYYDNCKSGVATGGDDATPVQLGPRPFYLVEEMSDGALKEQLMACAEGDFEMSDFSIGHRGAPLQFPEHTEESYRAAAAMGAGILECDVTFTSDKELVCRHSQCDLHTTTNILATDLADKCSVPFTPAQFDQDGNMTAAASAQCCTSDITLAEFKTLQGKMDAADSSATTVEAYLDGTAAYRTDGYASRGTLLTHAESIELFKALGAKMTPELKGASVDMPFDGFSQEDYAQKMIDEYKAASIPASDVFVQSFNYDDVIYWVNNEADFGNQAVYLDGRYEPDVALLERTFAEMVADGVKIIAPPMWVLLDLDDDNQIVASDYAKAAKAAGLDIITWTLERSPPAASGLGWYFQTTEGAFERDGDYLMTTLDVLAKEVEILGIFSDWPATATYYANCMGM